EAVAANAAWQAARRDVEVRDRIVKENLRDLTRAVLEAKIETLRSRVAGFERARASADPLPRDFAAPQHALRDAEPRAPPARAARRTFEAARDDARRRVETLRGERDAAQLRRESARTAAAMKTAQLAEARTRASDDDVARRVETTGKSFADAEKLHRDE